MLITSELLNKNVGRQTEGSRCMRAWYTHRFNGPFSGTTQVSQYQKGITNLDFTEARDSEWQWLQLGHVQVCTSLHTDNHTSTPPLSFLQAGCLSCHPTNSVKALKAIRLCWLDRALLINHNRSNVSLKTEQADARPLLSTVDVAGIRSIFSGHFWDEFWLVGRTEIEQINF